MEVEALRTGRLAVLGLDTTTGVPAQITEVAVMYVDGGVITAGPFAYWVAPDAPMHQVRHRSWANVRLAPPWPEVAEQVLLAVAGRVLVTHDAARVDVLRRHLPDWEPAAVVHIRVLAERVWPGLVSYDLGSVSVAASLAPLPQSGPGAVAEAYAVALLLPALFRDAGRRAARAGSPAGGA